MHVRHSLPPFMSIGLFQKHSKEGVGELCIYISEKNPLNLYICILPLKNKLSPLEIPQICPTPLGNSKTKNLRPMENPHNFFLVTPRKSTSFLIDSGIYFSIPLQIPCPESPLFFPFSGIGW